MKISLYLFLAIIALAPQINLFAAGFEKSLQWSAKQSARAGAVASSVEGADALYFNPAGLLNSSKEKTEISANITPTIGQFEGPIVQSNSQVQGNRTLSTPFALLSSYQLKENLGLGLGVYSSGGTSAKFEQVNYSAQNPIFEGLKPDVISSLAIIEGSLGLSYKINQNFQLGAAYRLVHIKAHMASGTTTDAANSGQTPDIIIASDFKNVEDTRFNGYRLGFQYQTDDKRCGFGVMYRSAIKFKGEGDISGNIYTILGKTAIENNKVTIENEFPQQIDAAVHYTMVTDTTLFLGYTWSEYSRNKTLKLTGRLKAGSLDRDLSQSSIKQDWYNMHNFRLAVEQRYLKDYAIRLGHVYTTQVTNENAARATFSSPGPGNTSIVGLGIKLTENIDVDGAFEYSFAKGRGKTADVPSVQGKFQSSSYSTYFSGKYRF